MYPPIGHIVLVSQQALMVIFKSCFYKLNGLNILNQIFTSCEHLIPDALVLPAFPSPPPPSRHPAASHSLLGIEL